jgi:hypothetical protein
VIRSGDGGAAAFSSILAQVRAGAASQYDERGDAERDAWLRRAGFRVLRFPDDFVIGGLPIVVERIGAALRGEGGRTPFLLAWVLMLLVGCRLDQYQNNQTMTYSILAFPLTVA